jgi:uncharacterized protein with FMN-binding domain
MRRAIAAFVATIAGLVVLLSFKTVGNKSVDRPVAVSGSIAGTGADEGTGGSSGSAAPTSPPSASSPAQPSATKANGSSSAAPSNKATTASPTPRATAGVSTKTVTGASFTVSEGFRTFGSVQVKVTLVNGKITKLEAIDYPNNDPRSSEISQYSIPVLAKEVLAAQGTHINVVSGATYTSEAYAQSVQAAIDSAKS